MLSSQTPTALWYFDTPTGSTYTNNIYNSGNPPFYLGILIFVQSFKQDDNGSGLFTTSARYVANGMYFEGDQLACTHAPASTTIENDKNFSVEFWAYVNILNAQSLVVCKYWHGSGQVPNSRFCIGFDTNGQMIIFFNGNGYNQNNALNILSISSCQYALGWNHVVVTFTVTSTTTTFLFFSSTTYTTTIVGYVQTDSGLSTTGTTSIGTYINDDPSNQGYLCAGAGVQVIYGFGAPSYCYTSPFIGIVNMIAFYFNIVLTSAQVSALYSTNCQGYCKICQPIGTAPYICLQQKAGYYQKYDFTEPTYPTTYIVPDQSSRGYNLAVSQYFAIFPIFVDQQGVYFDTTFASTNQYFLSTAANAYPTGDNSFTFECWIRPSVTPTGSMNIFEKLIGAGNDYLQWRFGGSSSLQFALSGSYATYNCGTIAVGQWHFIAASVLMYSVSSSQICQKIDTVATSCTNINKIFSESGYTVSQIGNGFSGYMMNLYVYDYAKEDLDLKTMVQTTGCTANANGNTCSRCDYQNGTCYVDCNYNEYVNSTTNGCTSCYASCRSCWDAYGNTCFSCTKNPSMTNFDYVQTCYSACGDGIRDDYEGCDDGNTKSGDGCDSTCNVENSFSCMGGSFNTPDVCYALCGLGIPPPGGCDDKNQNDGDGCDSLCNIETGWACSGTPSTCHIVCGDGLRVGTETCDDGNTANGDGCTSSCQVQAGFNCTGGSEISKDYCQEICGDGKDFGKYGCDDGNIINYDGCDQNCRVEVGFTCSGGSSTTKDTCTEKCGDGRDFHTFTNECDDGNTVGGDGCSSACKIETGFKCLSGSSYTKDTCYEICGDGLNEGHVQCDDGNIISGDGCHSDCTIEIGWLCSGGNSTMKDTCTEICGDGRNFGSYACDDGNLINGDGCSINCTIEGHYNCTTGDPFTKSICVKSCDGIRDFTDMCDDGNMINGDGCDYCCHREVGFSCNGGSLSSADTCTEDCGDGRKLNILPCDDGNTLSGDGCSSVCAIETGFNCGGGTLFTPDVCSEICGDGKNFGLYQCDDGNVASDDGCSSTCEIEAGFSCTLGNATTASICKEICGDGKNMKSYLEDCDDGNTKSGDGCSSTCLIETGFQCTQGGFYNPDICVEICGDGLNYGMYQCDDGNTQDGDGCSSYCRVEQGFQCSGGSKTSKDNCYGVSTPVIYNAYITTDNSQIVLQFNETVYMASGWTNTSGQWTVTIYGPYGTNNYQYYWDVNNQVSYKNQFKGGTKEIIINLDVQSQLFGGNVDRIIVGFNDRTQIRSYSYQTPLLNTSVIIYPYGQDDTTSQGQSDGISPTISTLTVALTMVSLGLGFIGSLYGNSLMDVWIMVQGLQQLYLFPVNNLYVPSALTNYILNLQFIMPQSQTISNLCFGGATNYTQVSLNNPSFSYTYTKMGYPSNAILQTASDVLSILIYCLAICTIIEIVRVTFDKKKELEKSLFRVRSSIMVGYFSFAFTKLAFTSHLNLKHISFSDSQNSISSLLSIGVAIGCWIYMFYTGYQAYEFYREIQILRKRYPQLNDDQRRDMTFYRGNILFEDYTIFSYAYPFTLAFPAMMQLKTLIIVCCIVTDNTLTQLLHVSSLLHSKVYYFYIRLIQNDKDYSYPDIHVGCYLVINCYIFKGTLDYQMQVSCQTETTLVTNIR